MKHRSKPKTVDTLRKVGLISNWDPENSTEKQAVLYPLYEPYCWLMLLQYGRVLYPIKRSWVERFDT